MPSARVLLLGLVLATLCGCNLLLSLGQFDGATLAGDDAGDRSDCASDGSKDSGSDALEGDANHSQDAPDESEDGAGEATTADAGDATAMDVFDGGNPALDAGQSGNIQLTQHLQYHSAVDVKAAVKLVGFSPGAGSDLELFRVSYNSGTYWISWGLGPRLIGDRGDDCERRCGQYVHWTQFDDSSGGHVVPCRASRGLRVQPRFDDLQWSVRRQFLDKQSPARGRRQPLRYRGCQLGYRCRGGHADLLRQRTHQRTVSLPPRRPLWSSEELEGGGEAPPLVDTGELEGGREAPPLVDWGSSRGAAKRPPRRLRCDRSGGVGRIVADVSTASPTMCARAAHGHWPDGSELEPRAGTRRRFLHGFRRAQVYFWKLSAIVSARRRAMAQLIDFHESPYGR